MSDVTRFRASVVRCGGNMFDKSDPAVPDHDVLRGAGGGCLVCTLRARISELEDTIRYLRARAVTDTPDECRGADWTGAEVADEPEGT